MMMCHPRDNPHVCYVNKVKNIIFFYLFLDDLIKKVNLMIKKSKKN